jgi:V8-like Glu-specific endopeptidase
MMAFQLFDSDRFSEARRSTLPTLGRPPFRPAAPQMHDPFRRQLMTDRDSRRREAEIEKRWNDTRDQVSATVAAIDAADPCLANNTTEIIARHARLRKWRLGLEAIVGDDDSLWLTFLSQGLRAAQAVGRIVLANQPPTPVGTGVLVSRRMLLTNNHVIPDPATAAELAVEMGYEYNDDGSERAAQTYPLDPDAGFFTDADRDFTVVAVSEVHGVRPGDQYNTIKLISKPGKALKGERLNVIHHPNGDRKRISVRENRMVAEDDTWVRYTSDTRPGSSGAPVFNDQWEMVALHHGGVPRRDHLGRRLTQAGQPITDTGDGVPVEYVANEGVRVSRIIQRLTSTTDPAPVAMVQEILATGADA